MKNSDIFYASLVDPATGCESSVRLQINIQVNDTRDGSSWELNN